MELEFLRYQGSRPVGKISHDRRPSDLLVFAAEGEEVETTIRGNPAAQIFKADDSRSGSGRNSLATMTAAMFEPGVVERRLCGPQGE